MQREIFTGSIVIGQRVNNAQHWAGGGVVVAIHGEQSSDSVGSMSGVVMYGGGAAFDVVYDTGRRSNRVPECIVRGGGWTIYGDVMPTDAVIDAVELAKKTAAEDAEKAAQDSAEHTEQYEFYLGVLRESYPQAVGADAVVRGKQISSQARAAKNLRAELKNAFPCVKFSVKSSSFSMGNDITVGWEMGPTKAEVDAIADKYEYGRFDAMQDLSYSDCSAFGDAVEVVLGRAKYVSTSRKFGDDVLAVVGRALCEKQGVEYIEGWGPSRLYGPSDSEAIGTHSRRVLADTSYAAGAVVVGVESVPNDERERGQEPYRVVIQQSEAAQAKPSTVVEETSEAAQVGEYTIGEHTHTKKGFKMWVCVPAGKLDSDEFSRERARCKAAGGWYSRKWQLTPGGFAFDSEAAALEFCGAVTAQDESPQYVETVDFEAFAWV